MIEKAYETPDGRWLVTGPVASLKEDYDKEIFDAAGIMKGLEMHAKLGNHVDYEHQYRRTMSPAVIIGKRIDVGMVDGKPMMTTELYKGKPLAKEFWEHVQAGGEAGYSVEGICKSKVGNKIMQPEIHMVTLSVSPKGFDARVHPGGMPLATIAKALVDDMPLEGWIRDYTQSVSKAMKEEEKDAGGDDDKVCCPECGHKFTIQKAMTTGEGIVTTGAKLPGDASPIREQELMGADKNKCEDCGKEVKGKSKYCFQCAVKHHSGNSAEKEPTE